MGCGSKMCILEQIVMGENRTGTIGSGQRFCVHTRLCNCEDDSEPNKFRLLAFFNLAWKLEPHHGLTTEGTLGYLNLDAY